MTATPAPAGWAELLELVERLDASDYADVSVELPGLSLRMSRHALPAVGVSPTPPQAPSSPAPRTPAAEPPIAESANAAPAASEARAESEAPGSGSAPSANLVDVTAPLLGVLHRRPAPDQPPFVAVGDEVDEETTVAIIEVMKMMNHVAAGVTGRVAEIVVADGDLVEFDQVLLRIDPPSAP